MPMNIAKDPNPGLTAAREDRSFCGYVNGKTALATATILTDSTFIQEIPAGKRVVVSCFYMYISTVSDYATLEFVATQNPDGTGTVKVLSGQFRMDTGAALVQTQPSLLYFDPVPLVVDRNDGAALSCRVLANDADAAVTVMIHGWEEDDHNRQWEL